MPINPGTFNLIINIPKTTTNEDGEKSGWIRENRIKIFWLDFKQSKDVCFILNYEQISDHIPIESFDMHFYTDASALSQLSHLVWYEKNEKNIRIPHSSCFHFLEGNFFCRCDGKGIYENKWNFKYPYTLNHGAILIAIGSIFRPLFLNTYYFQTKLITCLIKENFNLLSRSLK